MYRIAARSDRLGGWPPKPPTYLEREEDQTVCKPFIAPRRSGIFFLNLKNPAVAWGQARRSNSRSGRITGSARISFRTDTAGPTGAWGVTICSAPALRAQSSIRAAEVRSVVSG